MWEAIGRDRMVQLLGPQEALRLPGPTGPGAQRHQQGLLQAQASQTNTATPIPALRDSRCACPWSDLSRSHLYTHEITSHPLTFKILSQAGLLLAFAYKVGKLRPSLS